MSVIKSLLQLHLLELLFLWHAVQVPLIFQYDFFQESSYAKKDYIFWINSCIGIPSEKHSQLKCSNMVERFARENADFVASKISETERYWRNSRCFANPVFLPISRCLFFWSCKKINTGCLCWTRDFYLEQTTFCLMFSCFQWSVEVRGMI